MRRVLALSCCLALAGCATTGGAEVEGRASQVTPPPSTVPLPSGTPVSADPVAILRADDQVDAEVKAGLAPCGGGAYPVDDRYADLTGDGEAELVVTVTGCWEILDPKVAAAYEVEYGAGYAGYVYDLATTPPTMLLDIEGAGVELVPNTGGGNALAVVRNLYLERDDPCCPSDQTVTMYRWNGAALVEVPK